MTLPKFIITMDGVFRLGMVNQHKDLLKPGDQCIGGGYYHFDYTTNRILLDRESYDFGRPKWHLIWRTQDEIRTVVNAVLGESIWNLSYNERRMAIELELTQYLEEEDADALINQFPIPADYDGIGSKGTKFVFYI
jgi:hypothetical protein